MVLGTEFGSTEFCRRLANTVRNVCQGEVAQSSRLYDLSLTREEYFEIIRKKTASLFSASTGGAGWISGVDVYKRQAQHTAPSNIPAAMILTSPESSVRPSTPPSWRRR